VGTVPAPPLAESIQGAADAVSAVARQVIETEIQAVPGVVVRVTSIPGLEEP